jgi:hypothetical protein
MNGEWLRIWKETAMAGLEIPSRKSRETDENRTKQGHLANANMALWHSARNMKHATRDTRLGSIDPSLLHAVMQRRGSFSKTADL